MISLKDHSRPTPFRVFLLGFQEFLNLIYSFQVKSPPKSQKLDEGEKQHQCIWDRPESQAAQGRATLKER